MRGSCRKHRYTEKRSFEQQIPAEPLAVAQLAQLHVCIVQYTQFERTPHITDLESGIEAASRCLAVRRSGSGPVGLKDDRLVVTLNLLIMEIVGGLIVICSGFIGHVMPDEL